MALHIGFKDLAPEGGQVKPDRLQVGTVTIGLRKTGVSIRISSVNDVLHICWLS